MNFKGRINLNNRSSKLDIYSTSNINESVAIKEQDDFFVFSEADKSNINEHIISDGMLLSIGDAFYQDEPFQSKIESADDITLKWLTENCDRMYGHFLLLYFKPGSNEVLVVADKASVRSFYYHIKDGILSFSSNVLYLPDIWDSEFRPKIRETAIFEFLATGNLWGRNTYWEGVKRLGPAECLHLTAKSHTVEKYWQFRFDDTYSSTNNAISALQNAIHDDIKLLPDGKPILTLSGGYDSRALLGYLDESPQNFDIISYSLGAEYEDDFDAEVASYYAAKIGRDVITHEVDLRDIDRILADIDRAIEITGGETDTIISNDALLGTGFYSQLNSKYDYLLRGDEVWGWGDYAFDSNSAFWQAILFNVSEVSNLEPLLVKSSFETATGYVKSFRSDVQRDINTIVSSKKQLQDYIYWDHREARVLQTNASFRRQFIPHYAPFLFGNSFNVVNNLSDKQRVNKSLFLRAMEDKFPILFQEDNKPTEKRAIRSKFEVLYSQPKFQNHLIQELFENPHPLITKVFDMDLLKSWGEKILHRKPGNQTRKQKYNTFRKIYDLSQKNIYVNAIVTSFYINLVGGTFPTTDSALLYRIFVLNKSLKKYDEY